MKTPNIPHVLTIAGSDPSGGAGIQADLKTFCALGAYGMSAMTALTAQNTTGVKDVFELPPEFITSQIDTIFEDIRVDALKTGMMGGAEAVQAVAEALKRHNPAYIVVDPVMVASTGARLVSEEAVEVIRNVLLPLASVITPNIPEAGVLLGREFDGDMEGTARDLLDLGAQAVLLKGGHLSGDQSVDIYMDHGQSLRLVAPRIDTKNTHGTGCSLSAALCVYLARGMDMKAAAESAKTYLTQALRHADDLDIGAGHGPVHHFYKVWGDE